MTMKPLRPITEQERAYFQRLVDETCEPEELRPHLSDTQADHNTAAAEGWGNQTMPNLQEFSK